MTHFEKDRLDTFFTRFRELRIAVVGDVMLDRYIWGSVNRISPEAPVPVVDVERETEHPGGASNVALNIRSLGAEPLMFGVVGNDAGADGVRRLFEEENISRSHLVTDPSRPTTVKTRIIAHSQHVVRIDYERRQEISREVEDEILARLEAAMKDIHGVILQDYNKGMMSERIITETIRLARQANVLVTVDPKFRNFFAYAGADVFKPNRQETANALGTILASEQDFARAAREIKGRLRCGNVLLTLGEQGMLLLDESDSVHRVGTRARKVADVSGAGDTVISTLTVALAGGADILEAASLANLAGGLVCEEVGIVPIDRERLYREALRKK